MMQQTETYKLNKPESTDTFSVGPLNENADKIETALAALDGTAADLDARVTALEAKKIVLGTYTGTGGIQTIDLGFTPLAVVAGTGAAFASLAITGYGTGNFSLTENGFRVSSLGGSSYNMSTKGHTYFYVAFG